MFAVFIIIYRQSRIYCISIRIRQVDNRLQCSPGFSIIFTSSDNTVDNANISSTIPSLVNGCKDRSCLFGSNDRRNTLCCRAVITTVEQFTVFCFIVPCHLWSGIFVKSRSCAAVQVSDLAFAQLLVINRC